MKIELISCFNCGKSGHFQRNCPGNLNVIEPGGAPRFYAIINGRRTLVLSDMGCGVGLVIHPKLVREGDYTGRYKTLTLANGTQSQPPIVMVIIDSEYVRGWVQAVCLENCIEEAIMGYKYILDNRNIPDTQDNICVLTQKQTTALENTVKETSMTDRDECRDDIIITSTDKSVKYTA